MPGPVGRCRFSKEMQYSRVVLEYIGNSVALKYLAVVLKRKFENPLGLSVI